MAVLSFVTETPSILQWKIAALLSRCRQRASWFSVERRRWPTWQRKKTAEEILPKAFDGE